MDCLFFLCWYCVMHTGLKLSRNPVCSLFLWPIPYVSDFRPLAIPFPSLPCCQICPVCLMGPRAPISSSWILPLHPEQLHSLPWFQNLNLCPSPFSQLAHPILVYWTTSDPHATGTSRPECSNEAYLPPPLLTLHIFSLIVYTSLSKKRVDDHDSPPFPSPQDRCQIPLTGVKSHWLSDLSPLSPLPWPSLAWVMAEPPIFSCCLQSLPPLVPPLLQPQGHCQRTHSGWQCSHLTPLPLVPLAVLQLIWLTSGDGRVTGAWEELENNHVCLGSTSYLEIQGSFLKKKKKRYMVV